MKHRYFINLFILSILLCGNVLSGDHSSGQNDKSEPSINTKARDPRLTTNTAQAQEDANSETPHRSAKTSSIGASTAEATSHMPSTLGVISPTAEATRVRTEAPTTVGTATDESVTLKAAETTPASPIEEKGDPITVTEKLSTSSQVPDTSNSHNQ